MFVIHWFEWSAAMLEKWVLGLLIFKTSLPLCEQNLFLFSHWSPTPPDHTVCPIVLFVLVLTREDMMTRLFSFLKTWPRSNYFPIVVNFNTHIIQLLTRYKGNIWIAFRRQHFHYQSNNSFVARMTLLLYPSLKIYDLKLPVTPSYV